MNQPGQRLLAATWAPLSLALLVPILLGLGCVEPEPTSLAEVLAGQRYVGPALVGLAESGDCTVSDDFIPKIRCGQAPERKRLLELDRRLLAQLGQPPKPANLQASAVVRLATDPESKRVRQAIALLQEALADTAEPKLRAELLTDLSAAYLLLAETDQSAMELGFALDTALQALELEPQLEAAQFNRKLALILLGVERADPAVDGPLLVAVDREVFEPSEVSQVQCATFGEVRAAIDRWSADQSSKQTASLEALLPRQICMAGSEDRWLTDFIEVEHRDPTAVARGWLLLRKAEGQLGTYRREEFLGSLALLAESDLPQPLSVQRDYLSTLPAYFAADYERAEQLLEAVAANATAKNYLRIAATATNLLGVISGIRGHYALTARRYRSALDLAKRSESPELTAAFLGRILELEVLSGRESVAWREGARTLRVFTVKPLGQSRTLALLAAARLAEARRLQETSLYFYDRYIEERNRQPGPAQVEALLNRALMHLKFGQEIEAHQDYQQARRFVETADENTMGVQHYRAILDYFEGLVEPDADKRLLALQRAAGSFQESENRRRAVHIRHEIAKAAAEMGQRDKARRALEASLADLSLQIRGAENWRLASALAADARDVVDDLLDLLAQEGDTRAMVSLLSSYFSLRSGNATVFAPPPNGALRITTFVREHEVVLLLERNGRQELLHVVADRQRLDSLRTLLLGQLESGAHQDRIKTTLASFSNLLLSDFGAADFDAEQWIFVLDDVLSGVPMGLMPLPPSAGSSAEEEILLERVAVSYSANHRALPIRPTPNAQIIAVGARGAGSGLPELNQAPEEARQVGALYADSAVLTAVDSGLLGIHLQRKAPKGVRRNVHIAGHFELNTTSPLDSTLVLDRSSPNGSARVELSRLLAWLGDIEILVLSACNSGNGLPISARGLHSLAQAYSAAGIETSVLSLWSVDDRVGAEIAIRFHQLVQQGMAPSEALRRAQLEKSSLHLSKWASFAVFH